MIINRLMSHIKRRMTATGINMMQMHEPQSWEGGGGLHVDLLRQILLVGESLARLGTAEFGERSNSSRAINTKDYATLLQQVRLLFFSSYGLNVCIYRHPLDNHRHAYSFIQKNLTPIFLTVLRGPWATARYGIHRFSSTQPPSEDLHCLTLKSLNPSFISMRHFCM